MALSLHRCSEHRLPGREPHDPVTDGLDDTGQIEAEHERKPVLDVTRQHPFASLPVGGIDAGIVHPHEHLARPGLRVREIAPLQSFRSAE